MIKHKPSMATPTNIELEHAIEPRLDQLAHSTVCSKAFFHHEFIAHGMDDLDDIYISRSESGAFAAWRIHCAPD
jgi:predicted DNA-binding protein